MIEVHHFKVRNVNSGAWDIPPSKRTVEDIAKLKGEIIPDTMEMVFKAMLDSEGRYFPPGPAMQVERPVKEDKKEKRPK
jgi:hypothetical protein